MLTINDVLDFIRRVSIPDDERGDILVTFRTELAGTDIFVDVDTVRIELGESESGELFYFSALCQYHAETVRTIAAACYFVDSPLDVVRTDNIGSRYTVYLTRH